MSGVQSLKHQAGLPALRKPLPVDALYDWELMTTALAEETPWWEPGSQHGYHALTFGYLVGELVRRISGQSLGSYFRRHVAEPLGADFHIGLAPEYDARTSDLRGSLALPASGEGPKIEGPIGDFLRDMTDPTTMTGATFSNPKLTPEAVNSRQWRAAEIPAGNGHGTARALARIGGAQPRDGLLRALADPDEQVVAWAAYGLGQSCEGHREPTVRALAATADVVVTAVGVREDAEHRAGHFLRVVSIDQDSSIAHDFG